MATYICNKCGKEKDSSEFYIKKNGKVHSYVCKECVKERYKQWRNNNLSQSSETKRKYMLLKRYDITIEEYEEMFNRQEGKCAICGIHENDTKPGPFGIKRLCVDHDHNTGEVRKLLCNNCNSRLGWYELNKINIKTYLNE